MSAPVGSVAIDNESASRVTVTGVKEGQPITCSGNGEVDIVASTSNTNVVNNGTGAVKVSGVADGGTLHCTGNGDTTVVNPVGSLSLDNSGPGIVTVSGVHAGDSVTALGSSPVNVSAPEGNVNVVNNGTGVVTVSGVHNGCTVSSTGSGLQTVDLSNLVAGQSITLDNEGSGAVTLINVPAGVTVYFAGHGHCSVESLLGDVTLDNIGAGQVSVASDATIPNGSIIHTTGTGPISMLTNIAAGNTVHVDVAGNSNVMFGNNGAGTLDVVGAANVTLNSASSGLMTVTNPVGDITVNNTSNGPLTVSGLDAGKTLTVNSNGPTTLNNPNGDVTLTNEGTGQMLVSAAHNGATIHAAGSGPIIIDTALSATEKITLDLALNHNVQINNTGAGGVESKGNLALDSGNALSMAISNNHTPVLTELGTVSLGNAPLRLNLPADFIPVSGETITLIANDSNDPVVGTFAGLSEGSVIHLGNYQFMISYVGGTGNDVVLTVDNPPTGQVLVNGMPIQGQTLTASNTLADLDVIPSSGAGAISYQWLADGTPIKGATDSSFVLTQTQVAEAVNVVASYIDGIGSHESVASASTMVQPTTTVNTPPAAQSVVSSITVTPTGSNTTSVISLALNNTPSNTPVTDCIAVSQYCGTEVVTPQAMVAQTGILDFSSTGNTTGSENFSLYVDKALAVNGYWVQNESGTFVNLASPTFGGNMVAVGDKVRLDFTIQDGGQFDTSNVAGTAHTADGTITAAGAAAQMELSIVGLAPVVPVGHVWF